METVVSIANALRTVKSRLKSMFLADMNRLWMRCKSFASSEKALVDQTLSSLLGWRRTREKTGSVIPAMDRLTVSAPCWSSEDADVDIMTKAFCTL